MVIFVGSNGGVGLRFSRSKHLDALELGTTST